MKSLWTPAALALASGLALLAAAPSILDAGKNDGERLKRLFDRPIKSVQSLQGLTAQPSARLVARTGMPNSALSTVRLYAVLLEREVIPARTAFLDLPWKGKPARLGYAVTSQGGVFGPKAFDEYGKPLTDLDPFLAQFRGQDAVRLTEASTRPIGEVIKLREDVLAESTPPPKHSLRTRWALVRHHLLMFEAERLLQNLKRAARNEQPLRRPLEELTEFTSQLHQFATHLKVVLEPKEVGQYRRFLTALETEANKASELVSKGDAEGARELVTTEVERTCVECHDWKENHWNRPFGDALRDELDQVGFARGSFVLEADVRRNGLDPERAQDVASVVKAIMLLAHDVDE